MLERFLDQIGEVLRLCEDTDGILVVNREGIIEYHRIPLNSYWCSQDTVGRHILELYPELAQLPQTFGAIFSAEGFPALFSDPTKLPLPFK